KELIKNIKYQFDSVNKDDFREIREIISNIKVELNSKKEIEEVLNTIKEIDKGIVGEISKKIDDQLTVNNNNFEKKILEYFNSNHNDIEKKLYNTLNKHNVVIKIEEINGLLNKLYNNLTNNSSKKGL